MQELKDTRVSLPVFQHKKNMPAFILSPPKWYANWFPANVELLGKKYSEN